LQTLIWKYEREMGVEFPDLRALIMRGEKVNLSRLRERIAAVSYSPRPPVEIGGIFLPRSTVDRTALDLLEQSKPAVLPEELLERFRGRFSPEALDYLRGPRPKGRALTDQTIEEWELGWHEQAHRVVIPVRDMRGQLVGLTGRDIREYEVCPKCGSSLAKKGRCPLCDWRPPPKFLHGDDFKRDWYLFGEHKVERRSDGKAHGILVEGFFDVMWLWQLGYRNIVAMIGSYLSVIQIEKMVRWFSQLTTLTDGDPAGEETEQQIHAAMSPRMPVHCVRPPEGSDPDDLDLEFLGPRLPSLDNERSTCYSVGVE
jgi:hypothetical protein